MISHRQVMINCAGAIRGDESVLNYCVENFGRGLAINVGAYPSTVPGVADSPFLHLFAAATENELVAADQYFTMHAVLGGCVTGQNGEKVITQTVAERTPTANGLTINGGNKIVEDLRDLVIEKIRACLPGAIIDKVRRVENDLSHFPLEWAEFEVDFYEPESLN